MSSVHLRSYFVCLLKVHSSCGFQFSCSWWRQLQPATFNDTKFNIHGPNGETQKKTYQICCSLDGQQSLILKVHSHRTYQRRNKQNWIQRTEGNCNDHYHYDILVQSPQTMPDWNSLSVGEDGVGTWSVSLWKEKKKNRLKFQKKKHSRCKWATKNPLPQRVRYILIPCKVLRTSDHCVCTICHTTSWKGFSTTETHCN